MNYPNRFNNESTIQEGATMGNNRRFLTFEYLRNHYEHLKSSDSENDENTNNHEINLKIKKGNEIIGKADIYHEDDGVYLGNFEIFPKYRGRGYANTAMIYLINDYHIDTLVVVKANTIAINLYKKFGFTVDQEYYAKDLGCDVYYMKRTKDDIPDNLMKDKDDDIMLENQNVKLNKKGRIFESGDFEGYGKDVNLEDHDCDPVPIGSDNNDIHNEYSQKDIDVLNKLISSEQSAISEYLEAAKETNVDILSRLYSDIGDEERFHSEQLMFAKASLTGERYEPRDPAVKKEYEELLSMGMDEESAMVTAIDKVGFTSPDDNDDSDIKEIQDEFEMIEESYDYVYRTIDLASVVMETSIDKHNEEMDKHFDIFVESFLYAEAMDNTAQVPKAKNPIVLILKGLAAICKFIGTMCYKFKNFVKRLQIKQKRIHEWIKANGIQGLFQQGVSLYFYSPNRGSVIDCFMAGLSALRDYGSLLFRLTDAIGKKTKCFTIQKPADIFEINHAIPFTSVEDGLEKVKNVVMTRTKIVATATNEGELREVFFGYTPPGKKINDKSTNIYNILDKALSEAKSLSECINKAVGELNNCESDQNSIYYKNNELYKWSIKSMTQITNALNKYIKCLVSDMNQCVKLNNGILEQTHQADQDDLDAKKGNVNTKPTNPPPSR